MNKFAEVMYGKIANLYNDTRSYTDFKKLFTPSALILDVTNIEDVGEGYRVDFTSETEFTLIPPPKIIPPTQEMIYQQEAMSKKSLLQKYAEEAALMSLLGNSVSDIKEKANKEIVGTEDDVALYMIEVFPVWSSNSVEYKKNDRVSYNGVLYKVLTGHTSQESWKPDVSPSLFVKVISSISGEIPEWEQPSADNAYMKGDRVRLDGKIYESLIDNNVWKPTDYPAGWKDITDEIGE